jgi:serine/threonine protein kinase/Cdc6-like AAA superfamily ATPase
MKNAKPSLSLKGNLFGRKQVAFPFNRDFNKYQSGITLNSDFRFAHEPWQVDSNNSFIGRQAELDTMAERILFSNGGSFLVTGYRGVGKTSFVNQVIHRLEKIKPWAEEFLGQVEVLPVYLSIARPMQPAELMHHIIRRLYSKLIEVGIYGSLPVSLQEELTLAYHRTSINMKRTVGSATEWKLSANDVGAELGKDKKVGFKIPIGYTRSQNQSQEAAFLGYDDKAAEYDITHLSKKLMAGYVKPRSFGQRLIQWFSRKVPNLTRIKIIFIFDELDKLEEFMIEENGVKKRFIDEILNSLKNLFTTSGISFIFIAGKDLQESWLEELGRGDSVYESIFSYDKYLPCLWSETDQICDNLVDWSEMSIVENKTNKCHRCQNNLQVKQMFCNNCGIYILDNEEARLTFEEFKKYLCYKGRGIPRRIIRGFNEYVQWNGERPVLVFSRLDMRRIHFYANLQDVLKADGWNLFGNLPEEIGALRDKQLLGIYYLVDWMLRQGKRKFTLKEAVVASKQLSYKIAFAEEIAPQMINNLIKILLKSDYLLMVKSDLSQAQIGDLDYVSNLYKLSPKCLGEMSGLINILQEDTSQFEAGISEFGQYKLVKKIGAGGMATVYLAWDDELGLFLALKVLTFVSNPQAVERFKREGEVMSRLHHPNIVRYYGAGTDQGRFYIAMDYVDGADLNTILQRQKHRRLSVDMAISIIYPIVEALHYILGKGFVRNDIKPSNILLSRNGTVYLSDFGITKLSSENSSNLSNSELHWDTVVPLVIGTPHYISPEVYQDQSPDVRSDIYSLGVVLYEILTGQRPFEGDYRELRIAHLTQSPIPPSQIVAIPPELEAVILRCLMKDRLQRFQDFSELGVALSPFLRPVEMSLFIATSLQQVKVVEERSLSVTANFSPPSFVPVNTVPPTLTSKTIISEPPVTAYPNPITITGVSEASSFAPVNTALPAPPIILEPAVTAYPNPITITGVSESPSFAPVIISPPTLTQQTLIPVPSVAAWPSLITGVSEPDLLPLKPDDYLVIFKPGNTVIARWPLKKPQLYLGRDLDNDIVLDTTSASRIHARIVMEEFSAEIGIANRYVVEDLNSNNGTYVNGVSIHKPYLLRDKDTIQIAEYSIEFRQD